jgi:DNA mismatch endonuclease, patch repair protein
VRNTLAKERDDRISDCDVVSVSMNKPLSSFVGFDIDGVPPMDILSPKERSWNMSRIKGGDTRPERTVRSIIHQMGFRFSLHRKDMPGKPDIVLRKWKTVVLVHGCFWHGCRHCDKGRRVPKTNRIFWKSKVAANSARDLRVTKALRAAGWRVITVWECQINAGRLRRIFNKALVTK